MLDLGVVFWRAIPERMSGIRQGMRGLGVEVWLII
jgi:hypothetical protein